MPRSEEEEALLRAHMGNVERMRGGAANDEYMVAHDHSGASGRKPAKLQPRVPLASLTPISVAELQLGTTHKGRILRGTLVAPAAVMKGAMTVLEDAHGRLVLLAVYNMLPEREGMRLVHRAADVALPKGAAVAVIEPFFKRFMDGTCGVRVDDPRDLVHMETPPQARDAASWKEEGNTCFRGGQHSEAERCYTAALRALDEGEAKLLSGSLGNLAAALLAEPDAARGPTIQALLCAAAASAVDATYAKARFRAATALHALGDSVHARWCAKETQRLGGGGAECRALLAALPERGAGAADERSLALALSAFLEAMLPLQSGGSADAESGAGELKARGNASFADRRFADAAADYSAALRCLQPAAATLLSNRAACRLQLDRNAGALLDATAALVLDPSMIKAHFRRASALLALDEPAAAAAAVALGLQSSPQDAALLELRKRIETAPQAVPSEEIKSMPSKAMSEREAHRRKMENSSSVESVAMMNQLLSMVRLDPAARARLEALGISTDDRVPPFHTDFARAGCWPKACEPEACSRVLWDAYEHARSIQVINVTRSMRPAELAGMEPTDLIRRLGSNDPAALKWLFESPAGAVRDRAGEDLRYDPHIWHSFSNAENRVVTLTEGRTHVAVGFVDLGVLRDAVFSPKDALPGPLRFVGVEGSPYAVAKTAVVDAMLRGGAETDAVLQVWYSAAWSAATLTAFRTAVTDLLQRGGADNAHGAAQRHPEVAALLRAWQLRDVPLSLARKQWLKELGHTWTEIAAFTKRADRDAMCAYILTGQLLEADVGSVCMFVLPPGFPSQRALNECVFHCIPVQQLWRRRRDAPDVVAAAVAHLRHGIADLGARVTAGKLTVELRLQILSLSATAELASISALKPYTMSWSNVSDYMPMRDFHAMARACSGPGGEDTIHFGYSMNWPVLVKGASVLDWMLTQPDSPQPGERNPLQMMQSGAVTTIGMLYDVLGCKPYLLYPPEDDMRNLVDFMLYMAPTTEDGRFGFRDKWANAFFAAARLQDRSRQVGAVEPSMYSPLSRTASTVYFTYTYDPDITMTPMEAQ